MVGHTENTALALFGKFVYKESLWSQVQWFSGSTVVLWSDLGKICREGKLEMHGIFPNALVPSKLDLSH